MKINPLIKSCPNCKSTIRLKIYRNGEKIIQCHNCKVLLIENQTSKLISGILFFLGGFLTNESKLLGIPTWIGFIIIASISIYIAFKIINLKMIKKDLIIRNIQTNQISYVNKSDWQEILDNGIDKEINFEIIENLNT